MAKTFNPNRVKPGTIELVRAADGTYTTQVVGLQTVNSLSLPDISITAAVTKTDTDTKTATEITGDTLQSQTQMAFKTGDDNQPDTTGSMLQNEAKKTSDMLANVSTPITIQDSMIRSNRLTAEEAAPQENILSIQSPTENVFGKSTVEDKQKERQTILPDLGKELKGSAAVQAGEAEPPGFNFDFLKGDKFKQGTASTNPVGGVDQMAADAINRQEMISGATPDDATANTLGISADPAAETALDMNRFEGVSKMGTLADKDVKDVKPIKRNALKTVNTSLKTTGDSILSKIKTPMMMVIDAISDATLSPQQKNRNAFNANYFNVRDDGRISGNPATDVFAGMNRQSAFGDVGKSARDRIATREKTIERKGYTKDNDPTGFFAKTQNMKSQLNDYQGEKNKSDLAKGPGALGPAGGATLTSGSDQGGGKGGNNKIVCTMMNESYGFGSFRNKIWLRHSKNLAPEYQIGYHRIFLPLVKKAKTNKILKKILEHIAIHRTIDIRQEERNKIHLLGRAYRAILEPICYWAGKK
jgi:hypothetical protein